MKLQNELVDTKIDRHGVIERNIYLGGRHLHPDLVACYRKRELLGLLEDFVLDVVLTALGIAGKSKLRFCLERVLKLVICEIWRDNLHGRENDAAENKERKDKFELGTAALAG